MSNIINPHRFAAAAVTRESDLAHWWKMDETSGTTVADSIPAGTGVGGAELALPNGGSFVTGLNGNALDLDGADDIAISASGAITDFGTAGAYTMAIWVNFDVIGAGSWYTLWHLDQEVAAYTLFTAVRSNGYLNYHLKTSGAVNIWNYSYSPGFTTGQWYHYVQTWDGSDLTLYVDGDEKGSLSAPSVQSGDMVFSTGKYTSPAYALNGKVDDIRIYKVALTDIEVAAAYGSGAGDW
jgi:hypothetical protein